MKRYTEVTHSVSVADVMEFVAHYTNGPEPAEDIALEWLEKNADAIAEEMESACLTYIRRNWNNAE